MEIVNGYYNARPTAWWFELVGSAETPCIKVKFTLSKGGELTWTGFLTEKTKTRTLEALVYMGFNSSDLTDFEEDTKPGVLDSNKEVSITVENETIQNGRVYPRVRWVNPIKAKTQLAHPTKGRIAALDLKADLMEIQQKLGVKPVKVSAPVIEDDLSF